MCGHMRGFTLVGSSLACKYLTRVEMNGNSKLAYYDMGTIMVIKRFIVHGPGPCNIKLFMVIIVALV